MKLKYRNLGITIIAFICAMGIIIGFRCLSRYISLRSLEMNIEQNYIEIYEGDQGDLQLSLSDQSFYSDVEWKSTDNQIVQVDNKGHYTALKEGNATLFSSIKGSHLSSKCQVSVHKAIKIEKMNITGVPKSPIYPDTEFQIKVELLPKTINHNNIVFESTQPSVISIDKIGNVKTLSVGKSTIRIYIKDTALQEEFELDVVKKPMSLESISFLEGSELTLETGTTYQLKPKILPEDADRQKLSYVSNNSDIIEVTNDGLLNAKRPGISTIVCSDNNGMKTKPLKVIVKCDEGMINQSLLENSGIHSCNKLMIVAHPDDETLWGGGHLLDGSWYVVCLTNGYNKQRVKELHDAMAISQTRYIILHYPDLNQNNKKDDWNDVSKGLKKDIEKILNYKVWDQIVTHNPEGEYGHVHHKKTNQLVTQIAKCNDIYNKLYYFGKFYSNDGKFYNKPILPEGIPSSLDETTISKKKQMINSYSTQISAINKYWYQMIPYEEWIKASKW